MPNPISRLVARGARGLHRGPRAVSQTSPLVDANGAAQMLTVPASWLLAQARAGQIPHHRLGHYVRFDLDELNAWLQTSQSPAAPRVGGRQPANGSAHRAPAPGRPPLARR